MNKYVVVTDEKMLDKFIGDLPELEKDEVYYLCLVARKKYSNEFPNMKNSEQLSRVVAQKDKIKEKILRFESTIGSYSRGGVIAPQESLAVYIGLNPRSLVKANKNLLIELANRIAIGDLNFNPISLATTEVHKASSRKFFVDFDFDNADPVDYIPKIKAILPVECFNVLKTRGGFHLIVNLEKIKNLKTNWHKELSSLPNCDVRGTNNITPVPGCVQGGFTPYFLEV